VVPSFSEEGVPPSLFAPCQKAEKAEKARREISMQKYLFSKRHKKQNEEGKKERQDSSL
jgi:hypothetical protein